MPEKIDKNWDEMTAEQFQSMTWNEMEEFLSEFLSAREPELRQAAVCEKSNSGRFYWK
jgi:hypothetical protein